MGWRLVCRVIDAVRSELSDREMMAALTSGRVSPRRDFYAAIVAGQMRCGKRPRPLFQVALAAARRQPVLHFSLAAMLTAFPPDRPDKKGWR